MHFIHYDCAVIMCMSAVDDTVVTTVRPTENQENLATEPGT